MDPQGSDSAGIIESNNLQAETMSEGLKIQPNNLMKSEGGGLDSFMTDFKASTTKPKNNKNSSDKVVRAHKKKFANSFLK